MFDLFINTESLLHCLMVLGLVVGIGTLLGDIKIKGISIGPAAILFVGIIASHFGLRVSPVYAAHIKDFGLALFVFTLGMQVGPGFFQTFRRGGWKYGALGLFSMTLSTLLAVGLLWYREPLHIISGILAGAVTSTPALAAAQQTFIETYAGYLTTEELASGTADIANAYALAYPIGTFGIILLFVVLEIIYKPRATLLNIKSIVTTSFTYSITNPAIFEMTVKELVKKYPETHFVISRIYSDGVFTLAGGDSVLHHNDKINVVIPEDKKEQLAAIFGTLLPGQDVFESSVDENNQNTQIVITNNSMTGKTLKALKLRNKYGVNITRVTRAGVEIVADSDLILQVGDTLRIVGPKANIKSVAALFGNVIDNLTKPNIVPIFLGICVGILIGAIPIAIPGVPQPVRLGLAGGTLIAALLLSTFGPRLHVTTYVTNSALKMINLIGISIFFACTGLNAGSTFMDSLLAGGYAWVGYGAIITIVPALIVALVCLVVFKEDFPVMCGIVAGGNANPSAMVMAQNQFQDSRVRLAYASIYPFSIFFRVVIAQILILIAV